MPWFWSRAHLRSQRLGYLRHGFYRLYSRLAEVLEAGTDTEALDRALTLVVSEAEVDAVLRSSGGKTRLKKVFR